MTTILRGFIMKYGNKKVTVDGITFDSKREANRYAELKLLEQAGEISNLELQKEFVLVPAQFENVSREEYINSKGKKTRGKCIEKAVKYKADFCYIKHSHHSFKSLDEETIEEDFDEIVVEDTKGFKTKDYIIKRKLMLYVHGIKIVEV